MKLRVFGEILWDIFDGDRRIGGAPFNFAAHSAALGADVEISHEKAEKNKARKRKSSL